VENAERLKSMQKKQAYSSKSKLNKNSNCQYERNFSHYNVLVTASI